MARKCYVRRVIAGLVRLVVVNLLGNLVRLLRNLPRLLRKRPAWVRVSLKEPLPARPARAGLLRRRIPSLAGLAELFRELADDARLEGLVLELHHVSGGWAHARSLRDLIARLGAKKRVVAHLSSPSLRDYYVACAAGSILVDESGPLALHGLAAEARFFRRALDKLGARAETEFRGAYKSMGEMLTRDDMSEAQRESLEAVLDRLEGELCAAVAAARGMTEERARELLRGGPYLAADAARRGLVDAVKYADEAAPDVATVKAWRRARRLPLVWRPLLARRRRVAVVPLHGAIVPGEGSGGRSVGSEAATRTLAAVREDPRLAAAVLHIDSRGGGAAASDLIWRQVRRLAEKKPVVAYLHDVAASGGYYVACGATRIVAQPTTLTGSIGVVGGKVSFGALLERAGVTSVAIARGEAATMSSPSRAYSDEERRRLAAEVDALYQQFVARVAAGRGLDPAEAERHARGRVWMGIDAHERKLVDQLGDVEDAIRLAESLSGGKGAVEAPVTPRRRNLLAHLVAGAELEMVDELLALAGDRPLYLAPAVTLR
jgi:protease-4